MNFQEYKPQGGWKTFNDEANKPKAKEVVIYSKAETIAATVLLALSFVAYVFMLYIEA